MHRHDQPAWRWDRSGRRLVSIWKGKRIGAHRKHLLVRVWICGPVGKTVCNQIQLNVVFE